MNLFYLDKDLDKSAEYHVDKHVNKMILEAAQLINTNLWIDHLFGFVPRPITKGREQDSSDYSERAERVSYGRSYLSVPAYNAESS